MGFYAEYFSTIFKNIWMTAAKERWEVRRIVNNLKKADHILYTSLFEEVEQKHLVTKAIRDEERLLKKNLRIAAKNAEKLMFNVDTEEIKLLEIVGKILEELQKFPESSNQKIKNVEKELIISVLQAMQKAEILNRKEYLQVELIIELAEKHENNPSTFMQAVRTAFRDKTSQSILAKFAARTEIRRIKVDLLQLKGIHQRIRRLGSRVTESSKKDRIEEAVRELYVETEEIKKFLNEAFHELFLIMHRDTLWMIKILVDLNNLFNFNLKWTGETFMPANAGKEMNQMIFEIEKKVAKEFHAFAQAFRIIVSKLRELEGKAMRASR